MRWFSIAAIYFLFWFMSLFAVLPFGMRTAEEAGERPAPGHAESAPHTFRPWRIVWRTSLAAAILTAAFYTIYRMGWIDVAIPAGTTLDAGRID
jgi:predicted secreted protein